MLYRVVLFKRGIGVGFRWYIKEGYLKLLIFVENLFFFLIFVYFVLFI